MVDYAPPSFQASAFKCPLCGAHSKQIWLDVKRHYPRGGVIGGKELTIAQCTHCNKLTFWLDKTMMAPASESMPFPNPHQHDEIKQD